MGVCFSWHLLELRAFSSGVELSPSTAASGPAIKKLKGYSETVHSRDNALNCYQMYELNPERNSENMPLFNHKTALTSGV